MPKQAIEKEAKYKPGQEIRLVNQWALKYGPDGLLAEVKEIRINKNGDLVYLVEAQRPPVPLTTLECDIRESS